MREGDMPARALNVMGDAFLVYGAGATHVTTNSE